MSTVGNVKENYGKKRNIAVTNVTGTEILESQMIPNSIVISSKTDNNGTDEQITSLFATDKNGNALRLTYTIQPGNGLVIGLEGTPSNTLEKQFSNDVISMAIDKYSIRTNPMTEGLYVQAANIIDNYTLTTQPYGYYGDYISVVTDNLEKAENDKWGVVKSSNPLSAVNIEGGELSIITDKLDYVDDNYNISGIVRFQPDDPELEAIRTIEASNGNLRVITEHLDIASKEKPGVVKVDDSYTYINENNEITLKNFRHAIGKYITEYLYKPTTETDPTIATLYVYDEENNTYNLADENTQSNQYYVKEEVSKFIYTYGIIRPDMKTTIVNDLYPGVLTVNTAGLDYASNEKFGTVRLSNEFEFDVNNTTYIRRYGEMISVIDDFYKYKTRTSKEIQDLQNRVAALEAAAAAAKIYSFVAVGADITELPQPYTGEDGNPVDPALNTRYSVTFSVSTNCKFKVSIASDANNVNPAVTLIDVRQGSAAPVNVTGGSLVDHAFDSTEGNETTLKFTFEAQNYSSDTDESKRDTIFTFTVTSIGENTVNKKGIHTFIRHNLTKYKVTIEDTPEPVVIEEKPDTPYVLSNISNVTIITTSNDQLLKAVNFGATNEINTLLEINGNYTYTSFENSQDMVGTQHNVELPLIENVTLKAKPEGTPDPTDTPNTIYYDLEYYVPNKLCLAKTIDIAASKITINGTDKLINGKNVLKLDSAPVAKDEIPLCAALLNENNDSFTYFKSLNVPAAAESGNISTVLSKTATVSDVDLTPITPNTQQMAGAVLLNKNPNNITVSTPSKQPINATNDVLLMPQITRSVDIENNTVNLETKRDILPYSVVESWRKAVVPAPGIISKDQNEWTNVQITKGTNNTFIAKIKSIKGITNDRSSKITFWWYDTTDENNPEWKQATTFYTEQVIEQRPTITANINLINSEDDAIDITLSRSTNARLVGFTDSESNTNNYWCAYLEFAFTKMDTSIQVANVGNKYIAGMTVPSLITNLLDEEYNESKYVKFELNNVSQTFHITRNELKQLCGLTNQDIDLGSNTYSGINIKGITSQSFTYSMGPLTSYTLSGEWIPSSKHQTRYYWHNAFISKVNIHTWDDEHMYLTFTIYPGTLTNIDNEAIIDIIDSTFKLKFIKGQHTYDWSWFYTEKYISRGTWSATGCNIEVHLYNIIKPTPDGISTKQIVSISRYKTLDEINVERDVQQLDHVDASVFNVFDQSNKSDTFRKKEVYSSQKYEQVQTLMSARLNIANKANIVDPVLSDFNYIKFNFDIIASKEVSETVNGSTTNYVYKTGTPFKASNNELSGRYGFTTSILNADGALISSVNLTNANYVQLLAATSNTLAPAASALASNDTINNLISQVENLQSQVNTVQTATNTVIRNRFLQ